MVTGTGCYGFVADEFGVGGVVAGFEAADVVEALLMLVAPEASRRSRSSTGAPCTPRAIRVARQVMARVFEPGDADWRGLGVIPGSGLRCATSSPPSTPLRRFAVDPGETLEPPGCRCGDVLRGALDPAECALFGARCTPESPVGACMVSSEGSCAAHYRYRASRDDERLRHG